MAMNEELVLEKQKRNEQMLSNHEDRLKILEEAKTEMNVKIDVLCEKLSALVKVLAWLSGVLVTGIVGLGFAYIQSLF